MTIRLRTFDLDMGAGRPHEQPVLLCPLFYLASGEYVIYSPESVFLWRSDKVPPEAYVPYSRYERLRECAEDIVRSDMGHDALQPALYAAYKHYEIDTNMTDPALIPEKYPEITWLLTLAEQEKK